jgi:phage baseplate assembly protein W
MPNPGTVQTNLITPPPYFVGFNTVDNVQPPFSLTNIDLIKRDILNQFYTIPGERVMLPSFGSNIPLLLMDPFDTITENAIIEDAIRVIQSEPRVELVNISIYEKDQAITILMTLNFLPESQQQDLFVTFTAQSQDSF